MGLPDDAPPRDDVAGLRVAVEPGTEAAGALVELNAVPVLTEDVTRPPGNAQAVAVDEWLLDDLGLRDSGVVLHESAHVFAAPPRRERLAGDRRAVPVRPGRADQRCGAPGWALMTPGHGWELPPDKARIMRQAVRLEWLTVAYLISAVFFIYLTLGSSQAMKTAWFEDILSLIPAARS